MQLTARWQQLDQFLTLHRALWQESLWANPDPQWAHHYPDLFQAALANSGSDDINHPLLAQLADLTALPTPEPPASDYHNRLFQGIKGRKEAQIKALLPWLSDQQGVFEWCCGKAHLARIHGRLNNLSGLGLELDPELCENANHMARQQRVDLNVRCGDALTDSTAFSDNHQVVALHACGDLHTHLISRCTREQPRRAIIAPCCYHRTQHECYRPQSKLGAQSCLILDASALRLICEQTTHASPREQKLTRTNQLWRLAFNALLNRTRLEQYLATPSIGQSALKQDFASFVQAQLIYHQLDHDYDEASLQEALKQGMAAQQRYHKLSKVRQAFSRALELWVVIDQAMRLEDAGYHVTLAQFCPQSVAARNLVIAASHN